VFIKEGRRTLNVKELFMKKKLIYLAMFVVLLALGMFFSACGNRAQLNVENDGSKAYYVQVIINGETKLGLSEMKKGANASFSSSSGISYRVRYSTTSSWNSLFGLYSDGTIDAGDSYTIKISEFEDRIF
jgi:hypothetical protein